jgi:hypothetical protein
MFPETIPTGSGRPLFGRPFGKLIRDCWFIIFNTI